MPLEQFPYTNFHELNLDWIVKIILECKDRLDDLEDAVDTLEDTVNTLTTRINGIDSSISSINNSITQMQGQIQELIISGGGSPYIIMPVEDPSALAEEKNGLLHTVLNNCTMLALSDEWDDMPSGETEGVFININTYGNLAEVENIADAENGSTITQYLFIEEHNCMYFRYVTKLANGTLDVSTWIRIPAPLA